MRLRTAAAAFVLAVATTLPLAGTASAQTGDRDCEDFPTQQEAQAALDAEEGDPERLDADDDGEACETFFDESDANGSDDDGEDGDDDGQVTTVPRGGVDTGDGTSADPTVPALLALGGLSLVGLGAAAAHRSARRSD